MSNRSINNSCPYNILLPLDNVTFPPNMNIIVNNYNNNSLSLKRRKEELKKIEEYLVNVGKCSALNTNLVNNIQNNLFTFDDESLSKMILSIDTFNSNIHANISCAINAILESNNNSLFAPSLTERIHDWFININLIGEPSVEGFALSTSLKSVTSNKSKVFSAVNLFVIKTPRDANFDVLIHEATIGLYCTNVLRKYVPNFMYVYGITKCSPLVLNDTKPVSWCTYNDDNDTSYLILENVVNSVSLTSFVKQKDILAKDIIVIFIQIINALNVAYNMYGFTHYDLHSGNVLIKKFSSDLAIPYYNNNMEIIGYISTQYVPVIIDYGSSRMTLNNNSLNLGHLGNEKYGINKDYSFPMYDLYKLLCFTTESLLYNEPYNENILNILNLFFSYFNEGDIFERILRRIENKNTMDYYIIDDSYRNVTYTDYISWLEKVIEIPIYETVPANSNLIVTDGEFSPCKFLEYVVTNNTPLSYVKYCSSLFSIKNDASLLDSEKEALIEQLNSHVNIEKILNTYIPQYQQRLNLVKESIAKNTIYDGYILPIVSEYYNYNILMEYLNRIYLIFEYYDELAYISSHLRSYACALENNNNDYDMSLLFNDIENVKERLISEKNIMITNQNNFYRNFEKLGKLQKSKIKRVKKNNVYEFWNTTHNNLL